MLPFDPFGWFYSLLGSIQEGWQRLALYERIRYSRPVERTIDWLSELTIISRFSDLPAIQRVRESGVLDVFWGSLTAFLQFSLVAPFRLILSLFGLTFEWLFSREWKGVLLTAIPVFFLSGLAVATWLGGRAKPKQLAANYYEMAEQHLQQSTSRQRTDLSELSTKGLSQEESRQNELPSQDKVRIAEMLTNRVVVLQPTAEWRFRVGALLARYGAFESSQKILKKIAPESGRGQPAAHGVMAIMLFNRMVKNEEDEEDEDLRKNFVHHAESGLPWLALPREVMLALSDYHWRQGNQDRAIQVLNVAADRFPGLHTLVSQRALAAGRKDLAVTAKRRAMEDLQAALNEDPANVLLRVRLAQMFDTTMEGLTQAHQVLEAGIEHEPTPLLWRAISEVYRIIFVRQLVESNYSMVDLNILDLALQFDPSNPLVADQIHNIVEYRYRPLEELSAAIQQILAAGTATVGTHAILAEIHLAQNNLLGAKVHLTQVFQTAPKAARFVNSLVRLHLEAGQLDDAIDVGIRSLSLLDADGLLKERYVDDLLHTMGLVFLQAGRNEDALSAFENALICNPNKSETHQELATYFRSTGDLKAAEKHEGALAEIAAAQKSAEATSSTGVTSQQFALPTQPAPNGAMPAAEQIFPEVRPDGADIGEPETPEAG
jgi:tetratricopeptide (TPR) repeat protein